MIQLRRLNLSFNQITDVTPLADLISLEFLHLFQNEDLMDLTPLAHFTKRTWIHHPSGGSISPDEIQLLSVLSPTTLDSINAERQFSDLNAETEGCDV